MANLPETAQWEAGVYQLETTDPVEGGPNGIDNQQAKQLANRTAYLKQLIEALDTGTYSIAEVDAAIAALVAVDEGLQSQINTKTAQATEAATGTAELASTAEAQAGSDDMRIMTALKVNSALTQFGLFGVSKNLSTGDADAISKNGMYYFSSGTNIPIPNGHLIHQQVTVDYAVQYFVPGTTSSLGGMYHRRKVGGIWQAWQEIAHTGNETTLLSGNGYKKFIGGLIIQWGIITGSTSGDVTVTFPISFPNSPFRTFTEAVAAGAARTTTSVSQSSTGVNTSIWGLDGLRKAEPIYWLAFGY